MNPPERIDPQQIEVCPDCFSVQKPDTDECPGCGSRRQTRETLDRLLMLTLVLVCFGLAWSLLPP